MNSNVQKRSLIQHYDTMVEFLENLKKMFPEDEALSDSILYTKNVVIGNPDMMRQGVEGWCTNMMQPLKKGSAKYIKAVESITGSSPVVYHAFAYRDSSAIYASSTSESLLSLDLHNKLQTPQFDANSKAVLWEYMDELNRTAYLAVGKTFNHSTPPSVPSREEIHADIQRRKSSSSGASSIGQNQSVAQGVHDLVSKFFRTRGKGASPPDISCICKCVTHASEESIDGKKIADACKNEEEAGFFAFLASLDDKVDWSKESVSSEEWDSVSKAISLSAMQSAIPGRMMSGIENVANKLAKDLMDGKTSFADLNVEAIGQQVLSGVDTDELNEFTKNIEKILPALGGMK